jgi:hypothetical protein
MVNKPPPFQREGCLGENRKRFLKRGLLYIEHKVSVLILSVFSLPICMALRLSGG